MALPEKDIMQEVDQVVEGLWKSVKLGDPRQGRSEHRRQIWIVIEQERREILQRLKQPQFFWEGRFGKTEVEEIGLEIKGAVAWVKEKEEEGVTKQEENQGAGNNIENTNEVPTEVYSEEEEGRGQSEGRKRKLQTCKERGENLEEREGEGSLNPKKKCKEGEEGKQERERIQQGVEDQSEKIDRSGEKEQKVTDSYRGVREVKGKLDLLSNFHESEVKYQGLSFRCVEGVYQYLKMGRHGVGELERRKVTSMKGAEAKSYVKGFVPKNRVKGVWLRDREDIMMDLLKCKGEQVKEFEVALKETKGRLIEHTVEDGYWGVVVKRGHKVGQNIFGKCLMRVRDQMEKKGRVLERSKGKLEVKKSEEKRVGVQEKNEGQKGLGRGKQGKRVVVVLGDSLVKGNTFKEGVRAMVPRDIKIEVQGKSGLRVSQLGITVIDMLEGCMGRLERGERVSDVVIHVGSNDGGDTGQVDVGKMVERLGRVGEMIREEYGEVQMWWSEVLPRPRNSFIARKDMAMAVVQVGWRLREKGWGVIQHPAFMTQKGEVRGAYFSSDGVHLDQGMGLEYFVREIAEGLKEK
jgi:ribA/ribD-fused uncharacterized protein